MIIELELSNFKSIGKTLVETEDGEKSSLDFRRLTVFCGSNSSGKSTVLQSILLIAQTLKNNVPSQTLVLNGPMVKLGWVNDIKSEFCNFNDISIGMSIGYINKKEILTQTDLHERWYEVNRKENIYIKEKKQFFKYVFSNIMHITMDSSNDNFSNGAAAF